LPVAFGKELRRFFQNPAYLFALALVSVYASSVCQSQKTNSHTAQLLFDGSDRARVDVVNELVKNCGIASDGLCGFDSLLCEAQATLL
jgi:hypothetical protein